MKNYCVINVTYVFLKLCNFTHFYVTCKVFDVKLRNFTHIFLDEILKNECWMCNFRNVNLHIGV